MPVLAALNQLWGDRSLCFNLWSEFFRISKLTKQHIQVLSCNLVLWLKETGTKVGSKAKAVWNPCRTDWWNFWGEIKLAVVSLVDTLYVLISVCLARDWALRLFMCGQKKFSFNTYFSSHSFCDSNNVKKSYLILLLMLLDFFFFNKLL